MKLNSYTITQGKDRAPARAFLKAIGLTDADMKKILSLVTVLHGKRYKK